MLFQLSLSVFLLTFCHWTSAQVPFPNHCPEVKIIEDFKLDDYMGIWYEYAKYPFIFEIGKKCMYARYENTGDGFVSVMNAAVSKLTGAPSNVTGNAKVLGSGQLAVVFPASRNQGYDKPNYLVLGTDYTSFVVVYSCANFTPVAHTKIIWILTRERKPSDAAIASAKKVMDDNKLSQTFLIETQQDDCSDPNVTTGADNDSKENSDETMATAEAAATTTVNANTEPNLTTTNSIDKA